VNIRIYEVTVVTEPFTVHFICAGESVDSMTCWDLRTFAIELLQKVRPNAHIGFDLRGTKFVDSQGLGMMVGVLKEARQVNSDCYFWLGNAKDVKYILQVTGLDQLLPSWPPSGLTSRPTII